MRRTGMQLLAAVLLCNVTAGVHAAIEVFACEPEWAALVKELGGEQVKASSATTALQDVHLPFGSRAKAIEQMRMELALQVDDEEAGMGSWSGTILNLRVNPVEAFEGGAGWFEVESLVLR